MKTEKSRAGQVNRWPIDATGSTLFVRNEPLWNVKVDLSVSSFKKTKKNSSKERNTDYEKEWSRELLTIFCLWATAFQIQNRNNLFCLKLTMSLIFWFYDKYYFEALNFYSRQLWRFIFWSLWWWLRVICSRFTTGSQIQKKVINFIRNLQWERAPSSVFRPPSSVL